MKINQGEITIGISELYNSMSEDERREFLQNLAWEDDIFEDTVSDISKGFSSSNYNVHITKTRKKLLEKVGIIEKSYIKDLLREIDMAHKYADYFRNSLWDFKNKVSKWNSDNYLCGGKRIKIPQYNEYPKAEWDLDKFVDRIIEKS